MLRKRHLVSRSGHTITRRHFLYALAGFGGAAAVHRALASLGLTPNPYAANAQTPRFPAGNFGQGELSLFIRPRSSALKLSSYTTSIADRAFSSHFINYCNFT